MINKSKSLTLFGLCSILVGITWGVGKYLINHVPGSLTYDEYNRMFTLPLLLALISSIGIYKWYIKEIPSKVAKGFGIAFVVSIFLLFLGNVIEFWIVLLQDKPNAYAAYSSGSEVFLGSHIGWATYLIGSLFFLICSLVIGIIALIKGISKYWNILMMFFGTAAALSIFIEIVLIPYCIGWILIGYYFIRKRNINVGISNGKLM